MGEYLLSEEGKPIAVLGGGAVAQTMAADLSLAGREVKLFELPEFEENVEKIAETGKIELAGCQINFGMFKRAGTAKIDTVTTDMSEALEGVKIINLCVPAIGHESFFEKMIPELEDGQIVSIFPDNFGSLVLRKMLREEGSDVDIVVSGWTSAPYGTRTVEQGTIDCIIRTRRLMGDALPSADRDKFMGAMRQLPIFDGAQVIEEADTVLEVGLMNPNPVVHTVGSVLNTGAIENAGRPEKIFGDPEAGYSMYRDGMSPAVARVQMGYYEEICKIAEEMGIDHIEYSEEQFMKKSSVMGEEFKGPFTDTFLPPIRGPDSVKARYFTEDIPIGTNAYYELAQRFGVDTPVIGSILTLGSIICDRDFREEGRSLEDMGIAEMPKEEIINYVRR